MSTPKAVIDTLAALRSERLPLAARLDAIDLAIENLHRIYGLHGTPQPLPLERRAGAERRRKPGRPRKPRKVAVAPASDDGASARPTEAATRRDLLLTVLEKAPHGLSAAELKHATPKMDDKDRSNALSGLRLSGKIQRAGNAWVVKPAA